MQLAQDRQILVQLLQSSADDLRPDHAASREAFKQAGREGLLPADLSDNLQRAAGMRNILLHLYETIDYAVVHQSIGPFLCDFSRFIAEAEQWKTEEA